MLSRFFNCFSHPQMTALMLYALQFCKSLQNVFAPLSVAHFDGKRKKKKERKITIKRFAVGWIHFVVFYFLLQRTWRTFQKHFSLATRMRQELFPSIFSLDFFFRISTQPRSWLSTSFWRLPIPPKSNSLCGNLTPFSGQNDWVWRAGSINCMQILLLFALLLLFAIEMPLSVDFTL